MGKRGVVWAFLFYCVGALTAQAGTITFENSTLLASFETNGQVMWDNSWIWNGQPRGPGNNPTDAQLTLQATINLYAQQSAPNVLYVQITNVSTTTGAYWFGSAFDAVTETGVELNGPFFASSGPVTFSSSFANPGEVLAYGGSTESTTPLTDTPGYQLLVLSGDSILIDTTDGASDGFTSLCCIQDASRIRGGGVFQLTFGQSVSLFDDLQPRTVSVASQYGAGRQYIEAARVPEPGILALLAAALLMAVVACWHRNKRESESSKSPGSVATPGVGTR